MGWGLLVVSVFWLSEHEPFPGWRALLPTLGLVQVGEQALADRYSYLPHFGLLLALVWGVGGVLARVAEVAPRLARGLAALLAVLCVALAAARAAAQLPAWSSSEELFGRSLGATARAEAELARVLAALPDSPQAHYELGRLRSRQGRVAEAEDAWREAVRLAPDWAEPRRALERARGQAGSTAR